jgi:acetate kinase
MDDDARIILTINGGSSSIKFALFRPPRGGERPARLLGGGMERIGLPGTTLTFRETPDSRPAAMPMQAANHEEGAARLIDWLLKRVRPESVAGIGHRVVHGGIHLLEHQPVTDALVAELKRTQPLDLAHLPRQIALIEGFRRRFPGLPQVACFDTAFHRDMPRVARMLAIPRKFGEAGLRRFGFHGISYAYLMEELNRIGDAAARSGRVILAHLGSGASMAAVKNGKPLDTTMAFTPTAGLVMGTRPGDIDPGLLVYLMRTEKLTAAAMDKFISGECGLLGVSETTYDMRELEAARSSDIRAAEAIDLFCYQAKKWIGAYAAALGGLDTLVFSGGIGEHAGEVRAAMCRGMEFLGLGLDAGLNGESAPVISAAGSSVTVRVIATDEEVMIAQSVWRLVGEERK